MSDLIRPDSQPSRATGRGAEIALCAALVALIWLAFGRSLWFGFAGLDDDIYVSDNARVLAGLSWDNVKWAFTTFHSGNWFPLTWLTFLTETSLFGVHTGVIRATNITLHTFSTLLFFVLLNRTTRAFWCSAMVAALFAIHPARVESVVWISERKDVLSVFLLLASLCAYTRYATSKSKLAYAGCVVLYACSLMSKSMGVTFPAILLLWDVWPLGRAKWTGDRSWLPTPAPGETWRGLLVEKLPMLLLALVVAWLNVVAQSSGGAVTSLASLGPLDRVSGALAGYAGYVRLLLMPVGLSPYYVMTNTLSPALPVAAAFGIALWLRVVWTSRFTRPVLLCGSLWFLGTLVPVIGLVQVGSQSMADRYTYLPSVGFFIAVVWGVSPLLSGERVRLLAGICAGVIVLSCTCLSFIQTGYWRDTETLYTRALELDPQNWMALYLLGDEHGRRGQYPRAIELITESIKINPTHARAYNGLANCVLPVDPPRAVALYRRALELDPRDDAIMVNLGNAYRATGQPELAADQYRRALRLNPDAVLARQGLEKLPNP